ncbi:peptide deformylase [Candidatus Dojkabacteria bacterium]|nr:peptide deformylase [Candidatus Dojkabacteria bacterium]
MNSRFEDIIELGNPILRKVSRKISFPIHKNIRELINSLMQLVGKNEWMGFSAPQVGKSKRIFIIASHPNEIYPNAPKVEPFVVINPKFLEKSDEKLQEWEGCVSIPGIRGLVSRSKEIYVQYQDKDGDTVKREMSGFLARIFQHEYDHLKGKLFLDRVTTLDNLMSEKEYRKRILNS